MKCDEHSALPTPQLTTRLRRDEMSERCGCQAFQEKTGFRAATWRYLCSTQAFTMVRSPLHYFLATDLLRLAHAGANVVSDGLFVVVNGSSASGKSRLSGAD